MVAADVLGLLLAFATAELIVVGPGHGRFDVFTETLVFIATLPGWVLVARLYGLYGQDDQRTNHTTTDEVSNVFNMVTVCTWLFFAVSWAERRRAPGGPEAPAVLDVRRRPRPVGAYDRAAGRRARAQRSSRTP